MPWKDIGPEPPTPPQRPATGGFGTLGRPIWLTTNYFEVFVANKKINIYHYDVTIRDHMDKEDIPKKKKASIFEYMKKCFPKVFGKIPLGYDSMKNAYSVQMIPQLSKPATYEVDMKPQEAAPMATGATTQKINRHKYKITLVKVNQAPLQELLSSMVYTPGRKKEIPSTPVQMIEVMFRHYRALKYCQVASRSFFSLDEEFSRANAIGGGKEGVTGFFGSLRPAQWKDGSLLLNLDMAHTAFYKEQTIIEFIKETQHLQDRDLYAPLQNRIAKSIEKSLKGLKIRVIHANRTYRFLRVTPEGADRLKFDLNTDKGQKKITVKDYMAQQYSRKLVYPSLNCLQVGNPEKRVYIPIELCKIDKGQRVVKKLSDTEVSNLIRSTAVPPAQRLQQIRSVAAKNDFNNDPMLKSLGFTISDMPLKTKGRVLPAPGLTMNMKNFQPYQGTWDMRDKMFHRTVPLKEWAVISYDGRMRQDVLRNFIGILVNLGKEKGMEINHPFDVYMHPGNRADPNPLEDFKYYKNSNPNIQLIMCVLPGRNYYGAIKKAGDTEVKIITQCVLGTNVNRCQQQTIGNILLKINAKMGGVNNIVTGHPTFRTGLMNFAEPFLIMGADVNHPPAGNKDNIPSLAAVVGSYDMHATKYSLERRVQKQRTEIIVDLTEITKNLLMNFYRQTKKKPNRIIMYRDGVSESQFKEVLASEMNAMRKACSLLSKDYKPGITFICVQKRHHTRLFCDEKDGIGKSKNVPPGTIVDRDITHPTEIDFYLCSHQGIQGTSKPTHYHILWDDNDLPIDELQMLSYKLCHVYSRCARAVSIPTPVYYAHWAAYRAKVYVQEILGTGSDSGSSISGAEGEDEVSEMEIRRAAEVKIDDNLACRLHYI